MCVFFYLSLYISAIGTCIQNMFLYCTSFIISHILTGLSNNQFIFIRIRIRIRIRMYFIYPNKRNIFTAIDKCKLSIQEDGVLSICSSYYSQNTNIQNYTLTCGIWRIRRYPIRLWIQSLSRDHLIMLYNVF